MELRWGSEQCTLLRVVDGDTIDVRLDMGFYVHTEQRFRLRGVDTPERGQPNYVEAAMFVTSRLAGRRFTIVSYKGDKYGRFLVDVLWEEGGLAYDLAWELVKAGLGKAYDGGARV